MSGLAAHVVLLGRLGRLLLGPRRVLLHWHMLGVIVVDGTVLPRLPVLRVVGRCSLFNELGSVAALLAACRWGSRDLVLLQDDSIARVLYWAGSRRTLLVESHVQSA